MSITLDEIQQYKIALSNKDEASNKSLEKICLFSEKVSVFSLISLPIMALISMAIIAPLYGIMYGLCVALGYCFLMLILLMINYLWIFNLGSKVNFPANKIAKKLIKSVYKGVISDVVDLNCQITRNILVSQKEELSQVVFEKKGIPGDIVILLLTRIENEKQKEAAKQKNKEERDALILAETPVGSILKEISEI